MVTLTIPNRQQIAALVGNDQRLILALESLFIVARDVDEFEASISANESGIAQNVLDIAANSAAITSLSGTVSGFSGDINDNATDIAALQAQVADLLVTSFGQYYMRGNSVGTAFGAVDTPVKVEGITDAGQTQNFDHTDNRLTYQAVGPKPFVISCSAQFTGPPAESVTFAIHQVGAGNGPSRFPGSTDIGAVNFKGIVSLENAEYIEIWLENNTSTSAITVSDMQVIAEALK